MGTIINASGVLVADLTFPHNETYAPTKKLPVVFAFQSFERSRYLNPKITYTMWDLDEKNESLTPYHDFHGSNWAN
ncbi:hypothetical protein N7499_012273 [Penicillium canescens]|uniref:DUF7136 domain-containing protein n=1 Tax=Penicillium canescens TaxID=5083 RepID=A0AAD6I324_PENCN|nr:uncharacterized protein N7446_001080 [Penicillium canescens]KAJ6029858.1 hypothetical protein N7460_010124 [Penicillium canescens]KAJ6060239.1 hypothetical protein N7444_002093 [Penicillium canescens]KAJ6063593.1 hypothetical protein N7499_012273 [Penicillium canescens]KAJ6078144.1 hypothetical protein N7446_001080 [Penicillium canescens]KAJ6154911.1 hypothetical protein N7485_013280 [Penicillium canescens]